MFALPSSSFLTYNDCFVTCVTIFKKSSGSFWVWWLISALRNSETGSSRPAWAIALVPGVCISTKAEGGGAGEKEKVMFFFKDVFILILCVWIFCMHVYLCIMWMQIPCPGEGVRCPGPGVAGACESLCECWASNLSAQKPWATFTTPKSWFLNPSPESISVPFIRLLKAWSYFCIM